MSVGCFFIILCYFVLRSLTVFASAVEVLDAVVEANPDGGEAHLSLQSSHQPVVQRLGPLGSDHGADGPEHSSVAYASHCFLLSLDLQSCTQGQSSLYLCSLRLQIWFREADRLNVNLLRQSNITPRSQEQSEDVSDAEAC